MNDEKLGLPLIPVRGIVVFPSMITSFPLEGDNSAAAIKAAASEYKNKVIIAARKGDSREFCKVGVIASVKQTLMLPGNSTHIIVEGLNRANISEIKDNGSYLFATADEIEQDKNEDVDDVTGAYMKIAADSFSKYYKLTGAKNANQEPLVNVMNAEKPGQLADTICASVTMPASEKQKILEMFDPGERLEYINEKLQREINILNIKKDIESKVKKKMEKSQRDYYLREELKVIHEELGDEEEVQSEIDDLRKKLGEKNLPEHAKKAVEKELSRMKRIPVTTPEANITRTYIEYMLSIPWCEKTEDSKDLIKAEQILNEDHYGLKKVKERILEYLAVRINTEETNSTILCLVGPPGVGKTSIAKSIARCLNRKYVRMSLGGVKDESEIRGHRRTYVSAMPGRIIAAMKQAGTVNPLMLLDEVDKLGVSNQGDPSAALLEVLDSEQNNAFRDNYLEVGYDLSKVLFICTANDVSTIPQALRDRMELIELTGYTSYEKKQIAMKHLVPKQLKENGLTKNELKISEKAVDEIIEKYCREAGVRKLERTIGKICRVCVKQILTGKKKSVRITEKNIADYLGSPKYKVEPMLKEPCVGVARGLAWTQVGGETLLIEVNTMKGSGKLELTGNMGKVMEESAKVALSYIRSRSDEFGIKDDFYKEMDISLHIPEGAVPKDGPSAGITMTTAMLSALTGKAVRNDVAMTGEVTIMGRVLSIGGLNEKVLAAKRIGITNIILPEGNNSDIQEMPKEIKDGMNFIFVNNMRQVVENAVFGGI